MLTCQDCNREFKRAENLKNHQNKKICQNKKFNCKYCENKFMSNISMYRHMRNNCNVKKEKDKKKQMDVDEKEKIYEKLLYMQNEIDLLKEENVKLKKKEKDTMANNGVIAPNNNGVIAPNNNGMINSTINNIVLVGYGQEDISKINKTELLKGIKSGFYSTLNLTDTIHFNPKYPEYHNVYISSMKNKYAMMYDGNDWTLVMKDELIDKLYDEKKDYIEENLDDFLDSLTKSQKKALDRWMELEEDHVKIKEIKDKIKLLLYNKRNIPLDTIKDKKKRIVCDNII